MEELQKLKDRLASLRLIPSPELKLIIMMHTIEQVIKERESKIKK